MSADNNPEIPDFNIPTHDRANLTAMEIMEVIQDGYPSIVRSERVYGITICRIARILREHDTAIEVDLLRQFTPD